MLNQRIKRLEKSLTLFKINQKNVEAIHHFFVTGDVDLIPDQPDLREVSLASSKVKDIELEECIGLLQVYQILKAENKVDSESSLFDYLRVKEYPDIVTVALYDDEELSASYQLMQRLGLFSILVIRVVDTSKFDRTLHT